MTFRSGVWGLVLALLAAAAAGCASPYVYYCDEGCGPDALSGRYFDGSAACGACDQTPACGPCEGTPEDPFCGHTVTGYLRQSVTCDAGCGDVYWGEWSYDPPDECDPCNNHGDWVGPQCCPPQGWPKLCAGLQGRRSAGGCCEAAPSCDGGCADCAGPGIMDDGSGRFEELQPDELVPTPQPEFQTSRLTRKPSEPYYDRHPNSRLVQRRR